MLHRPATWNLPRCPQWAKCGSDKHSRSQQGQRSKNPWVRVQPSCTARGPLSGCSLTAMSWEDGSRPSSSTWSPGVLDQGALAASGNNGDRSTGPAPHLGKRPWAWTFGPWLPASLREDGYRSLTASASSIARMGELRRAKSHPPRSVGSKEGEGGGAEAGSGDGQGTRLWK